MAKIFVGGLSLYTIEEDVKALFERYGTVNHVHIVEDRNTGTPRGFGFVGTPWRDAERAIEALDGSTFQGRRITVKPAEDRRGWHSVNMRTGLANQRNGKTRDERA
jgi:RNA recognition motif-containing protein